MIRRLKVGQMAAKAGYKRGCISAIARELGVHRSVVCRDLQVIELMIRHGYQPWQLDLIRRDDRTLYKLVDEPRLKHREWFGW